MALADDIRKLGDETRGALAHALDYYYQSREVWRLIQLDVDKGRQFTARNEVKGTIADQTEIAPRIAGYIDQYLTPATFQQLVAVFEAYFFDLLALWLTAHPGILYRKQVDLETVLRAADAGEVLRLVVERELNEVTYRRVADWFEYLRKLVSAPGPTADEVAALAEIKASRDILVHAQGVVNAVYVAKAGANARYAAGDVLELPEPYFRASSDLLEKLVGDVTAGVASKA